MHSFCTCIDMLTFPLNFKLKDRTSVVVSRISKDIFDFELSCRNHTKRTLRWKAGTTHLYKDRNGAVHENISEAITHFQGIMNE